MTEIISKPDLADISKNFREFLEGASTFFLTWDEDLTDFRLDRKVTVHIHSKEHTVVVPIPKERNRLGAYVATLCAFLFDKSHIVIAWDVKPFFTYLQHRLARHWRFPIYGHILHLKAGEAFSGVFKDKPLTYEEATKRGSLVMHNDAFVNINTCIYTPLAVEVLPGIETLGLPVKGERQEYCCYEIEGQKNGRLGSSKAFEGCFVPQAMSDEQKKKYSAGCDKKFISFDYKHMEVSVLQWLSQDKVLGDIIDSGEDVYSAIYRIVSESTCSGSKRKWMKDVFIWLLYGMQARTLSEKTGFSLKGAEALIDKVYSSIPAMKWLDLQQNAVKDCFGRVFDEFDRTPASLRNGIVQSPAALICLEKLISLYQNRLQSMEVVASIHDAYVCTDGDVEIAARYGKEILESPSIFAPDLKLKVEIKAGDNWGDLAIIKSEILHARKVW